MPVIVTRPRQEALRWVERLRTAQVDALALPLIEIEAVRDLRPLHDAWRRLASYRAVMFVSANAVRHFLAHQEDCAFTVRAWAPGPGTAEALREAGVHAAAIDAPAQDAGQFDSESLWQAVFPQVRAGDRVLVVRGGDAGARPAGREWLAERLADAGAQVDSVVAYERRAPAWGDHERGLARKAAGDGSTWLFSSSEAIGNLSALLPGQGWQGANALATHPRIAQAAHDAGFGKVLACRPAFEEVLACLQSAR